MSNKSLQRLSYIDFLKTASAFMIVMLHVSAIYVDMNHPTPHAVEYFINDFTRVALPIFIMISGALLLRDQYHFHFKKKLLFILKIYFFWSAFYVLVDQAAYWASGNPLLTVPEMLSKWLHGPYHFWYLTMLMGIYILMPILKKLNDFRSISYLLALTFFVLYLLEPLQPVLPSAVYDFIHSTLIVRSGSVLFYFLLGAWLSKLPLRYQLARLAPCLFILGLGLGIYRLFTVTQFNQILDTHPLNPYSQLLMAMGIFYGIRYAFQHVESGPWLLSFSRCTLHIYILSAFFIFAFEHLVKDAWSAFLPMNGLSILIWSVILFFCSYLAALLVRRINQWTEARRSH